MNSDSGKLKVAMKRLLRANLAYARERRELFDALCACITDDGDFTIPYDLWFSIKSCLTSKNDRMDDNKTLALDTAAAQIMRALQDVEEESFEEPERGGSVEAPRSKEETH